MTRLALFDCDGTLVDSTANICRAMDLAFAAHRLEPPCPSAVRRIVGLSLPQAMAALLPDAEASDHLSLSDAYKRAFHAMRGSPDFAHEPLFPGIAETIQALSDDGWLLGVATGKSDRGLAIILEHHALTDAFLTL